MLLQFEEKTLYVFLSPYSTRKSKKTTFFISGKLHFLPYKYSP